MPRAKEIETLIDNIGGGLTESAIRNRLLMIQERAEALDTALEKGEAALEECNSALHDACADLERLKADTQREKLPPKENTVEEIGREFLQFLARPERWRSLEAFAFQHGIQKIEAQYHANKLVAVDLIELAGYSQEGTKYLLTEKGTAYVVENGLV